MNYIQAWKRSVDVFKDSQKEMHSALLKAERQRIPPDNLLRLAEPADITIGQIVWYKNEDNEPFWVEVYEPFKYGNIYKAYKAHDGHIYGLDNAFIDTRDT